MIRRDGIDELEAADGVWTSTGGSYDADTGWVPDYSPLPVVSQPVDVIEPVDPPAVDQPVNNTPMYPAPNTAVCNCIAYPCDCDGSQPEPVVTVVNDPPPVVDVGTAANGQDGGSQTPTTQTPANDGDAADGETMKILGFPWYYTAIAVGALFLFSSTDGKD